MENNTAISAIEEMAARINAALSANGYKPNEASAKPWKKEVTPGQIIERIYLSGKKADGYVSFVDGKWAVENVSFMNLYRVVTAAVGA